VTRRLVVLALSLLAVGIAAPVADAQARPAVTNVAHRGASGHAPENTVAAVKEGVAMHADLVEIDVQRTSDGGLIVMHDTDLARTTDIEEVFPDLDSYAVADVTMDQVRQLDAGSWFDPKFAGEPVPTLADVLAALRDADTGLLLEVKSPELYPGIEAEIADALRADPWWVEPAPPEEPHRLVIQSFDWESMARSQELLPDVPHGLLGKVAAADIPTYAAWADQINPSYTEVDASYVKAVHDAGLEIYVYTVNTADDMRAQIDKGVDGIITNYPDVLADVLAG
jgi:glycerophosphoryl diester phosphodiesterase